MLQVWARKLTKWPLRPDLLAFAVLVLLLMNAFGYFGHLIERNYDSNSSYPLNMDLAPVIKTLRSGKAPQVQPINLQYNISFIWPNSKRCQTNGSSQEPYHLVIVTKSDISNTRQRNAIRNTWGQESTLTGIRVKHVFLVGTRPWEPELQKLVETEQQHYADLVQGDFWDTYYNNTYKTMMSLKWVVEYCPNAQYILLVDDNMYVSVRNLLHFLRNPWNYPGHLEESWVPAELSRSASNELGNLVPLQGGSPSPRIGPEVRPPSFQRGLKALNKGTKRSNVLQAQKLSRRTRSLQEWDRYNSNGFALSQDTRLYSGFVLPSAVPLRQRFSDWYVSLKEYPYNQWPPYIAGGAILLSRDALLDMYYASFYTKALRFDDIYLGILAKKAGIEPYHCQEFDYWKKAYRSFKDYQYVIAAHGYQNSEELIRVWSEQRTAGFA